MGASAGRVLLIPKGNWNSTDTYNCLDWVRHNRAAWVCKKTCINSEPSETNTEYWQLLAEDPESVADMVGATESQNGTHGLVPAPQIGDEKKALLGDGTWGTVDAIYSFKTEEEYNQAVENDEIPDGAKVIKEYDEDFSPIDIDDVMSDTSENPVQNKVNKKYVDDAKIEIQNDLSQLSNPNLLINPDFKINQRGQSEYTETDYTVDRWFNTEGINKQKIKVVDNGLSLINNGGDYCQIRYIFENMLANRKTYTVSMKINDNQILSESFSYDKDNGNSFSFNGGTGGYTVFIGTNGSKQYLYIRSTNNVIINWIKLELGSVATPFVPPDPATELLKCQRYYEKGTNDTFQYGIGGDNISKYVPYCVEKRVIPTVTSKITIVQNTSKSIGDEMILDDPNFNLKKGSNFYHDVVSSGISRCKFEWTADAEIY